MTEDVQQTGRRERKKLETREALRAAARVLFAEHGVAATSVEQITEAADVSERTFFRYFESKYDLLLPDLTAMFDDVEAALATRPLTEHLLVAYEEALLAVVVQQSLTGGGMATIAPGLDPADPAVTGRLARAFVSWEDRLTELFAERMRPAAGGDDVALQAAVTAAAAIAGTRAVVRQLRQDPSLGPAQRLETLRASFAFLRTGCGAQQGRRRAARGAAKGPST